jgi:glycosyltransferase involved in cell wall biosynthesis
MISILIPAYKATETISKTINSILTQKIHTPYEILIGVDGCIETLNYLKDNYFNNSKIRLFFSTRNVGSYKIKNSLFKQIQNENSVIMTFDSDDYFSTLDDIQNMYNFYTNKNIIYPNKYIYVFNFLDVRLKSDGQLINSGVIKPNIYGGTTMMTYSIFKELGGYHQFRLSQDEDLLIRARERGKIVYGSKELPYFYRLLRSDSLTIAGPTKIGSKYRNRIFQFNRKMIKQGLTIAKMKSVNLENIN